MRDYKAVLEPETVYHIYNRANGSERIFLSSRHYKNFVAKYSVFISPIADTFCYCLMPNHFHFLNRIKPKNELELFFKGIKRLRGSLLTNERPLQDELSKQFSNFFSSYTQSFNKANNRMGSLFMKNFNRILINSTDQFLTTVRYIHFNPIEAGLSKKPDGWQYSSYSSLINQKDPLLASSETIEWFGGMEQFKLAHRA